MILKVASPAHPRFRLFWSELRRSSTFYDLRGCRLRTTPLRPYGDVGKSGQRYPALVVSWVRFRGRWLCGNVIVRCASVNFIRTTHGTYCGVSADGSGARLAATVQSRGQGLIWQSMVTTIFGVIVETSSSVNKPRFRRPTTVSCSARRSESTSFSSCC